MAERQVYITGPPSFFTYTYEALHSASGLTWAAVIPCACVALRLATLPLFARQRAASARHMAPLMPRLARAMQKSRARGLSVSSVVEYSRERREIMRECGASFFERYQGVLVSVPLYISQVWGLRLAVDSDVSFAVEGVAFFSDLTAHDPYLRLPLAMAALSLYNLGKPPRSPFPGLLAAHYFSTAAVLGVVPMCHYYEIPEAIPLHLLTSAVFRAAQSRFVKPTEVHETPIKNPRW